MIIINYDKYVIYTISENKLIPSNIYSIEIVDGIIYENFIFVFLTPGGYYYHILNEENSYPCKLFKISDEIVYNHMKFSKKIKEKKLYYDKKIFPKKIIGIADNNLITSDGINEVSIREIDFILFKIIHLINQKRLDDIVELLPILEKKYIRSLLAILKYYFVNYEETIRKIFNEELVEHFNLYKYLDFFLFDLSKIDKNKSEIYFRKLLINNIITQNVKGISEIYEVCNKKELYNSYKIENLK